MGAHGTWNTKKDFKPPVHTKTKGQLERLQKVLKTSILFMNLEDKNLHIVVEAMEELKVPRGKKVIQEGDQGDFLFVVEEGKLDCTKKDGDKDVHLKTCETGDVFGELALMYNCPRKASVVSTTECKLWKLDRETFTHITSSAAEARRKQQMEFLRSVDLLDALSDYDVSQISDAMQTVKKSSGEDVVKQGDPGDALYFVKEGTLTVNKDGKEVLKYGPKSYFGELALLSAWHGVRSATVTATSDVTLLSLPRAAFTRMLGSLENTLMEKAKQYD